MELTGQPASDREPDAGDPSHGNEEGGDGPHRDGMVPPETPCECFCLHCRRVFMSDTIWFQRVIGARDGFDGFWMCPTHNCGGAGFTFDIFPTDPEHPANAGWRDDDGEEEDESNDDAEFEGNWQVDAEADTDADTDAAQYDPDEPAYKTLEEMDDEEGLDGEEWKHGLSPGERPKVEPPPPGVEPRTQAEEEALYDAPDRRPRELDWSNRPDLPTLPTGDDESEDQIPF